MKILKIRIFVWKKYLAVQHLRLHNYALFLPDIDECQTSPCKNAGNCVNQPGEYSCSCKSGYTGQNCEQGINREIHIHIQTKTFKDVWRDMTQNNLP